MIDGTFGMSLEKLLIFFLITTDEAGKSVLIGFFLFTPDRDALSAGASYGASILVQFLRTWASAAACGHITGQKFLGPVGTIVTPIAVMTDAEATEKNIRENFSRLSFL